MITEFTVIGYVVSDFHAIGNTKIEVVLTVAWCDMNETRTGLVRYEVTCKRRNIELVAFAMQRVLTDCAGNITTFECRNLLPCGDLGFVFDVIGQGKRQRDLVTDLCFTVLTEFCHFKYSIFHVFAKGDRTVGRHRPWRCCPDHDARIFQRFALCFLHRELDPDCYRFVFFIFNFGFGERGFLNHRPHYRLCPAI